MGSVGNGPRFSGPGPALARANLTTSGPGPAWPGPNPKFSGPGPTWPGPASQLLARVNLVFFLTWPILAHFLEMRHSPV